MGSTRDRAEWSNEAIMTNVLDWGIDVVLWFQQFSPALDVPFIILSFLGDEKFFLPLVPILYWCVDRRTGAQVGLLLLLSAYLNALVKDVYQQPRPFVYDARVRPILHAHGEGFPSGHTQTTTVFWGYMATRFGQGWVWAVAIFFMIFVPMSRIYVGAHFPTDLLGGYVLGVVLLLLYRGLMPVVTRWLSRQGVLVPVLLVVAAAVVLLLLARGDKNSVTAASMVLGVGSGMVLERQWVRFHTGGPVGQRVLRFLVGVVGLGILFGLLHVIFHPFTSLLVVRVVRYGLLGWWIGCGAPWTFVKLGLASRQLPHDDA